MNSIEKIQKLKISDYQEAFARNVLQWFKKERDGHMGKWQYFYPAYEGDPARGALLWEEWAVTDFYMLKNQKELIKKHALDIYEIVGPADLILDLGPGTEDAVLSNTIPFIDAHSDSLQNYVAVDLCENYAYGAAEIVRKYREGASCYAFCKDFLRQLTLPEANKITGLCFGGIMGNYAGSQQSVDSVQMLVEELKRIKVNLLPGSFLVVGLDTNQQEESLRESYAPELHGAYEINVLFKIKRDLLLGQAGFKPENWIYEMAWYPESYQFCHIAEATEDQKFTLYGEDFEISKGDQLVVDNSFKFPVGVFQLAAIQAGFKPEAAFLDDQKRMGIHVISI